MVGKGAAEVGSRLTGEVVPKAAEPCQGRWPGSCHHLLGRRLCLQVRGRDASFPCAWMCPKVPGLWGTCVRGGDGREPRGHLGPSLAPGKQQMLWRVLGGLGHPGCLSRGFICHPAPPAAQALGTEPHPGQPGSARGDGHGSGTGGLASALLAGSPLLAALWEPNDRRGGTEARQPEL